ncbi:DEAD/DEAH box helicase [Miniphocaeibacter halophilus]|uniref:DEAD/DEAH box helicase family protein n=1 Tax=Miniphocaeibacter halophilus TaxID=2931922 RepID=A0AC61MTW5_9FIRM|nr:DEAD/DEAH box helicase family protein [Miniphocaeibacter halophilus]QQK08833.1 DEAD/DEAH box helicase family protein [Miniphocaeibacter halophilus]
MMINLFDFQTDAKNYLLDKSTDPNSKRKIIMKSPTGSGKTIILLSYIYDYLLWKSPNKIFIWLTPGKGDLEEQSREKMGKIIPNAKTGNIHDALLQGFQGGYTYFINWEMITNKTNNALKDSEKKNLFERIAEAHREQLSFITIIDEEHLNNTSKADDILNALNADREIRVSATTVKNPMAEFYEIPEEEVINSGLITKALFINPDVDATEMDDLESETIYLLQKADAKRKEIKAEYTKIGEKINPLVIIQFPDMSESLVEYVEDFLSNMGYTYKNKMLAKWLSEEKINIENVTDDDAESNFLIMKQAISTGWDCPRAKILVKLRENMTETFETQTIGRIRRMPRAKHYDNDVLDFCFLYTFDEKYKESVIQGGNAYEVKRVFLKGKCKDFEMVKEYRNKDYQYVDEVLVRNKAYDFFKDKYKLNNIKKDNEKLLESYGFIMGTKVISTFRTGKFIKLKDLVDDKIGEHREIAYEVSTHDHGIDCLHAVDMIKKVTGVPSNKMRAILQHLFHKNIPSSKKLLSLSNREWYAFMINNAYKLRDDFVELAALPDERQMQVLEKRTEKWKLPSEDFYRYLPYETNVVEYKNNAYKEYNTSMTTSQFRSTSEQLLENYLEERNDVDWFYKNGDIGQQYLSIIYGTNLDKEYLFYPDYIVKKRNGEVWILETKGGERKGVSKNIDKQIENKFYAFKDYAKRYKINWGFVRDKDTRLYINNTVYNEYMSDVEWKRIEDVF